MQELRDLAALPTREQRAQRASALLSYYQDIVTELGRIRREELNGLVTEGWDQPRIAKMLGVTRARIGQLLSAGPQPERTLLGTGDLTVAIGGKWEAPKPVGDVEPAITQPATVAYQLLARCAAEYGLGATSEVVRPPGMVNLNRPNLIVIGSPRILPLVEQVLGADPHLGFGSDARGWYLTEHGEMHRSPADSGEPVDYAYIGRLPRPDSKGTFLYVAGIHGMGTQGAAAYLTAHIADIHAEVKGRRWSALVRCQYDPDTRDVTSTQLLTPIRTF